MNVYKQWHNFGRKSGLQYKMFLGSKNSASGYEVVEWVPGYGGGMGTRNLFFRYLESANKGV